MQVYNLTVGAQSHKPDASFEYEILRLENNKSVWRTSETTAQLANPGEQVTLQKPVPLATFDPGVYELRIKVTDKNSAQSTQQRARFMVE